MKERALTLTAQEAREFQEGARAQICVPIEYAPKGDFWRYAGFEQDFGHVFRADLKPPSTHLMTCPLGVVGDRLWFREAWCRFYDCGQVDYAYREESPDFAEEAGLIWKRADTMPREASRFVYSILSVRAGRTETGWFWVLELETVKP